MAITPPAPFSWDGPPLSVATLVDSLGQEVAIRASLLEAYMHDSKFNVRVGGWRGSTSFWLPTREIIAVRPGDGESLLDRRVW